MQSPTSYFKDFLSSINNTFSLKIEAAPAAILLGLICYIIYKIVNKIFKRQAKKLPLKKNVIEIINKTINVFIIFFSIMIIASTLGINTSSLIAAFSIFGLALSLSVQSLMSNVANAINIYANHPFKVDDYVDVGGIEGTIVEIGFMFTKIKTYKNEMIYIPNSNVGSSIIKNYSYEKYRRIEYVIGVSYDNEIETVKRALLELLNEEPLVEKKEDIIVFVNDYSQSSIDYTIRVYTLNQNYLQCLWSIKEHIKPKFDQHGITIPYPQLDVTIKQ